MLLTRVFKETVQFRAARDLAFREGLLKKSVECLLPPPEDSWSKESAAVPSP